LVGDFERDKVRSESEPEINLSKSTSGCVRRSKSRENLGLWTQNRPNKMYLKIRQGWVGQKSYRLLENPSSSEGKMMVPTKEDDDVE
jgi:hypothetical protein